MKTRVRYHLYLPAALLLLSAAAQAADYPTTVLSLNPVGYWRLSESVSPPAANVLINQGSLGAAANAYPAPYGISDPTVQLIQGVAGRIGNAIALTNPAPVNGNWNSMIDVPYNPAFNPRGSFSVEFWANPNSHNDTSGADLLAAVFSVNTGQSRSGWLIYQDVANKRISADWNTRRCFR